jgi:hypothetical protein
MTEDSGDEASHGDETTEQLWLVEREYSDKGMMNLVYASTDGQRYHRRQLSQQMLTRMDVTAGRSVDAEKLEPTHEDDCERYATEATRMADHHDPDDAV